MPVVHCSIHHTNAIYSTLLLLANISVPKDVRIIRTAFHYNYTTPKCQLRTRFYIHQSLNFALYIVIWKVELHFDCTILNVYYNTDQTYNKA